MSDTDRREIAVKVGDKVYQVDVDVPRSAQELCFYAGRHRGYLSAMKRCGFQMPLNPLTRQAEASLSDWMRWHDAHPQFSYNKVYKT